MLSTLSVGVGHWNGDVQYDELDDEDAVSWDGGSDFDSASYQRHNKTPRISSAVSHPGSTYYGSQPQSRPASRGPSTRGVRTPRIGSARSMCTDKADGEMILPKTFLTRRGALMLFTAPEKVVPGLTVEEANYIRLRLQQSMDFTDVGRRVNSMKDLFEKILSFGQTEQGGKIMMKFMKGLDERSVDISTQPGGDFSSYVKDVKSRTSSRPPTSTSSVHFDTSVGLHDSLWTLDRELGHTRGAQYLAVDRQDGRPSSGSLHRRVLSTDKLAASLRSITRPQTVPVPVSHQEERIKSGRAASAASARRTPSSRLKTRQDGRAQRKRSSARRVRMSPTPEVLAAESASDPTCISVEISENERLLRRPRSSRPLLDRPGSRTSDRPRSRQSDGAGRPGSALLDSLATAAMHGDAGDGLVGYHDDAIDDEYGYISEEGSDGEYQGEFIPYDGDVEDEIYDDEGDWSDDQEHDDSALGSGTYSGLLRSASAPRTFSIDQTLPQSHDLHDVTIDDDVTQMLPHEDALMELRPQHSEDEDIDSISDFDQRPPPTSPRSMSTESMKDTSTPISRTSVISRHNSGHVTREDTATSVPGGDSFASVTLADGRVESYTYGPTPSDDVTASSLRYYNEQDDLATSSFRTGTLILDSSFAEDSRSSAGPETAYSSSGYDVTLMQDEYVGRAVSRVSSGKRSLSRTSSRSGGMVETGKASRPSSSKKSSRPGSKTSASSKSEVTESAEPETDEPEVPKVYERKLSFDLNALVRRGSLIGRRDSSLQLPVVDPVKEESESQPARPPSPTFDSLLGEVSAIKEEQQKVRQQEKQMKRRQSKEDLFARRGSVSPEKHLTVTEEAEDVEQPETEHPTMVRSRPPPLASLMKKRAPKKPMNRPDHSTLPQQPTKPKDDLDYPSAEVTLGVEGDDMSESGFGEKGDEGMTIEELELEKKILEAKMRMAEEDLDRQGTPKLTRKASQRKVVPKKSGKKGGKSREPTPEEELEKQRQALKEQRQADKTRRLEEAMAMQQKIREKEEEKKKDLQVAEDKRREVESQMADLAQEANIAEELEEEVKVQMATVRAAAREERMQKRSDEIERKKQESIARRQRERTMVDAAREREIEMLEGIMDSDAKQKMWDEEKARQAEADRLYEEKMEEDLQQALQAGEEEEHKILQIEMQTEEETLARIRQERDEADSRRRHLMAEAEKLAVEEEIRRQALLEEQMKVAEERRKQLDEERRKQKEEKQRLLQLHAMEEAARERIRVQVESRRQALIRRRENNLEARTNLDGMRHSQETTRPWIFSYYILWPRSSYERPMGGDGEKRPRTGASKRSSSKSSSNKPMSAPPRA